MAPSLKKILLGVSGGIAAYKAAEVLRGLQKKGADVRVAMTSSATRFVQPLTFEALSHHPVHTSLFPESGDPQVLHVELAAWPDAVVVAPATADLLGKAANGLGDDLLSCILMATDAPVLVAPAMETQMYKNLAVQRNLEALARSGYRLIGPETGDLASGASGLGRMSEPEQIVAAGWSLATGFQGAGTQDLADRHLVVTAGRTEEDIDPVRFITNRSTGKMGYAVAACAAKRGARVTLVSGPTHLAPPDSVEAVSVRTVGEMDEATRAAFETADGLVMTAAVLDYRAKSVADQKIKKSDDGLTLQLSPTHDFLVDLGRNKGDRLVVGFAMETEQALANARQKLDRKCLDLIVVNDLTAEGAGFAVDTNVVTLVDRFGLEQAHDKMPKTAVADLILDWMAEQWGAS